MSNQYIFRRQKRKMPTPSCIVFAITFAILSMCIIAVMPPIITGIKIDMPKLNTQPIEIFDDFTYVTIVYENENKITINGAQIQIENITDAIKIIHKNVKPEEIKVFIKANKEISYNSIIALLQVLNNDGFTDVTLVGKYNNGIQNLH